MNTDLKANMERGGYYLSPKGAALCAESLLKTIEPFLTTFVRGTNRNIPIASARP